MDFLSVFRGFHQPNWESPHMRVHCPTIRLNLGATLGLALAAAIVTVSVPAKAEEAVPLDTKIIRNVLQSLGLKRPGQDDISYQERAPLVIPSAKDLPAPQQPGAAIANNPAWPKDPDIARAKIQADMAKNRDTMEELRREQNPLPPDQIAPGPRPSRQAARTTNPSGTNFGPDDPSARLWPSELGFKGGLLGKMFSSDDPASVRFTGPPPRTTLTEPPTGYQMPSPDQPYGLGKDATLPKAENSYVTRSESR